LVLIFSHKHSGSSIETPFPVKIAPKNKDDKKVDANAEFPQDSHQR